MRDKRPVDELSIEELERILAIRKRERRIQQLHRLSREGRRTVPSIPQVEAPPVSLPETPDDFPPEVAPAARQPAPIAGDRGGDAGSGPAGASPLFVEDNTGPRFVSESTSDPGERNGQRSPFMKRVWNRTLILVEALAFFGIIIIGVQMVQALRTLQEESAAVQAEAQAVALSGIPTLTPTPEISLNRIVLPSGHTSPTSSGGAQFNLNEIPANLRPIVQQQLIAPIAMPTPGPESPVRIEIPRLGVDAPVVSGTDWEALKRGVGHQPNSGLPGVTGNMVLSAHNDIYGELFRYLDRLQPGDEIIVHTLTQRYRYVVRDSQIVSPYAVQVMDPTTTPTTTLISCYPYQVDNQRFVVFADLQS